MQLLSNFFFIVSNSLIFIASVDVILSSKRLDSRCTYVAFNCCIVNKYLIYYYSNCIIFLQSIDKHSILFFFFSPRHIYFIVPGWQLKFLLFFVNYMSFAIDPLSANPTKWSNTLKKFVGNSRRIV